MTRLVVVGAGITGLTAAFEWRRRRPDDETRIKTRGVEQVFIIEASESSSPFAVSGFILDALSSQG